jgi:hypothetical protein
MVHTGSCSPSPKPGPSTEPSIHPRQIMSEGLVIIRTFGEHLDADEAQVELLSAGIYSLLFSEEKARSAPPPPLAHGIALAVHQRDADIADAVLVARPMPH